MLGALPFWALPGHRAIIENIDLKMFRYPKLDVK
jgi:hypothetical protein